MALALSILPVPARNASLLATRNGFAPTVAFALFTELLESSFYPSKDDRRPKEGQLHLESCRSDYDCAYRVLPGGNYVAALICSPSLNPWSRSVLLKEAEHACLHFTKSDKPSPGDVEKRTIELHSIIECILYGNGNLALACASVDTKTALHTQSRIRMFPDGVLGEDASAWGSSLMNHSSTFDSAPFFLDSPSAPASMAPPFSAPLASDFSDMVAALAAAEREVDMLKQVSASATAPFSRANSEAFSTSEGSSVGSVGGQVKSAPVAQLSMSDMFGDMTSQKSSPSSSKAAAKTGDDKDWSDDEEDDQPKKKKFVIKIKDTSAQPTASAAAVVPTISLSMPTGGFGAPAPPSGTRRRGAAPADVPVPPPSPGYGSGAFGGAFGGAFNSSPSAGASDPFASSFSSPSDPFSSGTADPFASPTNLSDRVSARVTQTVNAKFGADGIRYAISGEIGFHVKAAPAETVNFDLVASEVVPGESHNPAVATSTDSTTFHVHITPQIAQSFLTHLKFRLPDCKGFVPIRMTCMCRVNDGVLEVRAGMDVAPDKFIPTLHNVKMALLYPIDLTGSVSSEPAGVVDASKHLVEWSLGDLRGGCKITHNLKFELDPSLHKPLLFTLKAKFDPSVLTSVPDGSGPKWSIAGGSDVVIFIKSGDVACVNTLTV